MMPTSSIVSRGNAIASSNSDEPSSRLARILAGRASRRPGRKLNRLDRFMGMYRAFPRSRAGPAPRHSRHFSNLDNIQRIKFPPPRYYRQEHFGTIQPTRRPAPSQARNLGFSDKLSARTVRGSDPPFPLPRGTASSPGKGGDGCMQNKVCPAGRMGDMGETQRRELKAGLSGLRALGRRPPPKCG